MEHVWPVQSVPLNLFIQIQSPNLIHSILKGNNSSLVARFLKFINSSFNNFRNLRDPRQKIVFLFIEIDFIFK